MVCTQPSKIDILWMELCNGSNFCSSKFCGSRAKLAPDLLSEVELGPYFTAELAYHLYNLCMFINLCVVIISTTYNEATILYGFLVYVSAKCILFSFWPYSLILSWARW